MDLLGFFIIGMGIGWIVTSTVLYFLNKKKKR